MANNIKSFTNLDFEKSRSDLVDFLKTKTEFRDFNFDGAAISLLIDALTYTTHQRAMYANMSIAECFLDSAQLRGNVVSQAKSLSYIPRSISAAYAQIKINLTLDPLVDSNLNRLDLFIEKGTQFSAESNGQSFNFVTLDRFQLLEDRDPLTGVAQNPGVYTADIVIHEGILTTETFTYRGNQRSQLFTLSNKNADTDTITLFTKPDKNSTNKTDWFIAENITNVGSEDNVFFVQEGVDGFSQIYFGDNVIGAQPLPGTFISVNYLVTHGYQANGVNTFEMIGSVTNGDGLVYTGDKFTIEVIEPSGYGSDQETIDSIKASAPRNYIAQNRALTKDDYVSLLQKNYGFIETMSVWGGQENVPPEYGKVFISIKPKYGNFLSPLTKQTIQKEVLDKFSVISITPEIVDPDFTYAYVTSEVFFRKEQTTLTNGQLRDNIEKTIQQFFTSSVSYFKGEFRYSKFVAAIDNTDESIQSNTTSLVMGKIFKPTPNLLTTYNLSFFNPIDPGTIKSDGFVTSSGETITFKDDGLGNIDLYQGPGNGVLTRTKVGKVDYSTGTVTLDDYNFTVPANTTITLKANPLNFDLKTVRNNLIVLKDSNIQVTRYTSSDG